MIILVIIAFTLLFIYTLVFGWLTWGFVRTRFSIRAKLPASVPVSIIVCARNEELFIGRCIRSISEQEYPPQLIELIVVNDASDDDTLREAESALRDSRLSYRVISNTRRQGKKASVTAAMKLALNPLIVLRDADTYTVSKLWLKNVCDMNQASGADLIIGPVEIKPAGRLMVTLQAMELSVLNLLSCGSARYGLPFLSSGANLSFTKRIFEKVGGYARHAQIESGDDIFFLEDVKKVSHNGIVYLKSRHALVYTYAESTLGALLRQRIRWAAKIKQNRNPLNFVVAVLVFLINCLFLASLFLLHTGFAYYAIAFILVKFVVNLGILSVATSFSRHRRSLIYSPALAIVYPIYSLLVTAGVAFYKPRWK